MPSSKLRLGHSMLVPPGSCIMADNTQPVLHPLDSRLCATVSIISVIPGMVQVEQSNGQSALADTKLKVVRRRRPRREVHHGGGELADGSSAITSASVPWSLLPRSRCAGSLDVDVARQLWRCSVEASASLAKAGYLGARADILTVHGGHGPCS